IYEGTNGIQALDLMGRKVVANGGLFLSIFSREVRAFAAGANAELAEFVTPLLTALDLLDNLTQGIVARAGNDPREIGAASVEYLHLFGYTAYAYLWARMAAAAQRQREVDPAFHDGKLATARFYFARILPRVHSLAAAVEAGSESLYGLEAEQF
ncbi:acyl-CoA dehydrogenase C-terminal domain-containing protein, partial [Pseudomonas aeruginosa]